MECSVYREHTTIDSTDNSSVISNTFALHLSYSMHTEEPSNTIPLYESKRKHIATFGDTMPFCCLSSNSKSR